MLDITAAVEVSALIWTDPRVERLTAMWAQGFSASQIGGELGTTRNAVLGKIHRLGKSKARPETRIKPMRGPDRNPRPKKPAAPILTRAQKAVAQREQYLARLFGVSPQIAPTTPAGPPSGHPCSLQDLTPTSCRFPVGDPGAVGFHFCGLEKPNQTPYCAHHHMICYTPRIPSGRPFHIRGPR